VARLSGAVDLQCRPGHQPEEIDDLFMFPTVIYAPAQGVHLSVEQLGQLFFDFNALQTSVPTAMAMALDQSDVYIQFANSLSKMPFFVKNGGVEPRRATLGKKSTAFTTQQTLVRTVRGAMGDARFKRATRREQTRPTSRGRTSTPGGTSCTLFSKLLANISEISSGTVARCSIHLLVYKCSASSSMI